MSVTLYDTLPTVLKFQPPVLLSSVACVDVGVTRLSTYSKPSQFLSELPVSMNSLIHALSVYGVTFFSHSTIK